MINKLNKKKILYKYIYIYNMSSSQTGSSQKILSMTKLVDISSDAIYASYINTIDLVAETAEIGTLTFDDVEISGVTNEVLRTNASDILVGIPNSLGLLQNDGSGTMTYSKVIDDLQLTDSGIQINNSILRTDGNYTVDSIDNLSDSVLVCTGTGNNNHDFSSDIQLGNAVDVGAIKIVGGTGSIIVPNNSSMHLLGTDSTTTNCGIKNECEVWYNDIKTLGSASTTSKNFRTR